MYELKGKDLYSQNGEGVLLEYIFRKQVFSGKMFAFADIGADDFFHLSNTRHLRHLGFVGLCLDKLDGNFLTVENIASYLGKDFYNLISIDVDGNDYWMLEAMLPTYKPDVVVAEFNPAFTDSRAIKYNPDHVWDGTDYYGFSFAAGVKLAEKHGYKVIFQTGNMNMFMVRANLIGDLKIPPVTFEQQDFFKKSERTDWVMI